YDSCGALSRTEARIMCLPSGIQPRTRSRPGCHVRRFGSPPPDDITYTSVLPATVEVKAICEPSGEKYGSISTPGVEGRRRAWPPARGTVQRSPAYSNATRSRLTVG